MIRKIFIRLFIFCAFVGGSAYVLYFYETSAEFDPFDEKYTFHRNMEYEKWDTVFISNDRKSFTLKECKNHITYFYRLECKKIISKGFKLEIDTLTGNEEGEIVSGRKTFFLSKIILNNPKRLQRLYNRLALYHLSTISFGKPTQKENDHLIGTFNYKGKKIEKKLGLYRIGFFSDDSIKRAKDSLELYYDTDVLDKEKNSFEKFMDFLFGRACP